MKNRKRIVSAILAFTTLLSTSNSVLALDKSNSVKVQSSSVENQNDLRLWYTKPSSQGGNTDANEIWQQYTLPIGNGDMGGNVYGEIASEHITFNEKTLWTGGPSSSRPNYNGGNKETGTDKDGKQNTPMSTILKQVQDLFGKHTSAADSQASNLCDQLVGISDGYGSYQAFGDLYFDFSGINANNVTEYTRDLNLKTAISSVNFRQGTTQYNREYFVSNPDKVLAAKLSAAEGKLNLNVRFPSKQGATPVASNDTIVVKGTVTDNQMRYYSQLKVINTNGTITANGDKLTISDADSVVIYLSAATDYKNDYPKYRTGETAQQLEARVSKIVSDAAVKGYDNVKADHISDYSKIFSRVNLNLGQVASARPTNELLAAYNNGIASEAERRNLEVMLFQYGRYLTIASSREDSQLPSNLQGVWNNRNDPAWSSDYHMNVNLQMNYWPTYSTNMAECAIPLVNYVNSLREPGRETARIYAGVTSVKDPVTGEYKEQNGFMAHTQNTPFGWTCPGWQFDWGWSPAAVPWILQNCWSMYEYTGDKAYLAKNIYPMMKEEVNLYEHMLIWDPVQQRMVSSPTYSPEHGPRTVGNTYEQALIWQLYEDTIKAAEALGTESQEVIAKWKDTQSKLKPIQIGSNGQIKEWFDETTLGSMGGEGFGHRHMSHLLGLFPGDLISVDTPDYLNAALVSLNNRTDQSTGWGMGQRINTWARTGDGNRAYKLITDLFKNGIYQNLWDTHPPFQIDGNFGMTSGVAEMLLQSNKGYINFLPALPDAWATGSVSGLVAQGNFEVGMKWANGKASELTVKSNNGGECTSKYANIRFAKVVDSNGNNVTYRVIDRDKITFSTVKGETYTITNIPAQEQLLAAPTGLTAERIEANSVDLKWNAMSSDAVTYNVYRQVDNGDVIAIAKGVTATNYKDTTAKNILGNLHYQVSAVSGDNKSLLSALVGVTDLSNMAGYIDDRDPRIQYVGSWGDWDEEVNYAGTVKYLETPTGTETASLTFVGTGIEVVSVTNSDRGMYEVFIDGESQGTVDTYSASTARQKVIYSKINITFGKHTIKLRATNTKQSSSRKTKVELDAFKVLNNTIQKPTAITVSSASGITTLSKANSTLQMNAAVMPNNTVNKAVKWSVSNSEIATIDDNGMLTAKSSNGTVRVTATSTEDSSVAGFADVTVAIAGSMTETIVEDAITSGGSFIKNPAITWNGSWDTWAGEPEKHHGGTKTESGTVGDSISYTFEGTGIEVYVQKHLNFASFDISIDNVDKGNFSFEGSSNGDNQQLLAAFKNLTNGTHTIVLTIRDRSGKTWVNLDYFKVLKPSNLIVDKAALQTEIEAMSVKVEDNFTAETWAPFKAAYAAAVAAMNNNSTTIDDITNALNNLRDKAGKLVEKEPSAPSIPESASVEVVAVESKTLMLTWTPIENVVRYEVYKVVNAAGSSSKIKLGETTNPYLRLTALDPNSSYTFEVKAINAAGKSSAFPIVNVKTLVLPDSERPSDISSIKVTSVTEASAKIQWSAATDNVAVTAYKIYMNGKLIATTANLEYQLTGLTPLEKYSIRVVAEDDALNTSLTPACLEFIAEAVITSINPVKITTEAGTAPVLPEKVTAVYSDKSTKDVSVVWDAIDASKYAQAGNFTVEGKVEGTDTKAAANVTVTAKPNIVDKSALASAIKDAQAKLDAAVVGTAEGQYTKDAKDELSKAIKAAEEIIDNKNAAQDVIDSGTAALNKAINVFISRQLKVETKNEVNDASALVKVINTVADKSKIAVDITKNTIASKDVLNAIKGQDKLITFQKDGISWSINGKDLKESIDKDIDLSLKVVSDELKDKESKLIKDLAGKETSIASFSFTYDGKLPGKFTIKVFAGKDFAGKEVNVCRYYEDKNTYEVVDTSKTDTDGYISYNADHCSDYFVVEKSALDGSSKNNDNTNNKQNHTSNKDNTTDTTNNTNTTSNVDKLAKTGSPVDMTSLIVFGVVIMLSGGLICIRKRKTN
ncbi:glycoside hydrolase N-terminal domain-containing protein [Clostridium sp. YIM B02515]|uniref:Glycoside hydrolase N-terminal domain-containing protein n=1 Tax=Clostridium rhizosphaerae TaxID=2803861 RepID=A0ABS1T9G9_9CLOT|nr:glycoside hydrolase N-terminal domain-containing protein [Clostridium rhizosphaerae]MBL4935999.1 glycoside hydrolase N-terminal domain-containing protein [Clostridium rhizosphaerae]